MGRSKGHRGHGEGSITERKDGRYQVAISLENGKRKYYYASSKKEAMEILRKVQHEQQQGTLVTGPQQTLEQYLKEWLQSHKSIRPRTYERYEAIIRLHLVPKSKEAAGPFWQNNDYVFCKPLGEHLTPGYDVLVQLKLLLQKAGLPEIRFHDLRHSTATMLLSKGVHPKIVQEILGHSEIGMTLNTYSHVLPTMQKEAMDKLDDLFNG